jgi:hypothetical protein
MDMSLKQFLVPNLLSIAVLFILSASTASAATPNVVGGQLMGASGVIVDGSSYNVEFLDGTCIALFSGCNEASDFTFQTEIAAVAASQALLDQVFLDIGGFFFDSAPSLTLGCNDPNGCAALTVHDPIDAFGGMVAALNGDEMFIMSGVFPGVGGDPSGDLTLNVQNVYAVWSPVPEPVPSLGPLGVAVLMSLLGLTGLALRRDYPASSRSRT